MLANRRRRAQRVPTSILRNARIFQKQRAASEESIKINRIVIFSPIEFASTCTGRKKRGGEKVFVETTRKKRRDRENTGSFFLLDRSHVQGTVEDLQSIWRLPDYLYFYAFVWNSMVLDVHIFVVCLKLHRITTFYFIKYLHKIVNLHKRPRSGDDCAIDISISTKKFYWDSTTLNNK